MVVVILSIWLTAWWTGHAAAPPQLVPVTDGRLMRPHGFSGRFR